MKKCLSLVLILTLVFSLAACGQPAADSESQGSSPAGEISLGNDNVFKLGICVYSFSNINASYLRKGMENYCNEDGKAEYQVVDAALDQTKQNEQIDTFLGAGVDALLINLVEAEAAATVIEKVRPYNIPIVFYNRAPAVEVLATYEKCWYVGIGMEMPGRLQAEILVDMWKANPEFDKNSDGTIQYCIIQGDLGHPDAVARTKANQEVLEASGIPSELLDMQVASWDTTKAKEVMEVWLGRYGDEIEVVLCNNDAMLLGVVEALRAGGYYDEGASRIEVLGINAIPQVLDLVESGDVLGTVFSDTWAQARACVDIALNVLNGKEPTEDTEWVLGDDKCVRIPDARITADSIGDAREAYAHCT